jgi:L-alanine-DL-glutamate epimerase-like enolase superfamily enzyme
MELTIHTYDLRLRHTFTIAHESRQVQPTVIVALHDRGLTGLGEATATRYYGLSVDQMAKTLEALRTTIETTPLESPEQYWAALHPYLKDHPFEQCALDVAAHDLHAQRLDLPLYQAWGLSPKNMPLTNYTIGIAPVEEMVAKMQEMPWPVYKIKLGTPDDVAIVRALRNHTDAIFRVDANCAWTVEQTLEYAPQLQVLGVEFIEQPLKPGDWEGMKYLYDRCALPLMADESCQREADVAHCAGHFHGVNVKLMKCGGLTPARRMIAEARTLNLKVMVGCMTESTVGISAIAHLLPLLDYVDMDGALLLAEDIATGVRIEHGVTHFSERAGTGARLGDYNIGAHAL